MGNKYHESLDNGGDYVIKEFCRAIQVNPYTL